MTVRRRAPAITWGPWPALMAVVVASGGLAGALYVNTITSAGDIGETGRSNALEIADLETRLGLGWTHDLSSTWLMAGPLDGVWVAVYALGYWPFLALAAGWVFAYDRARLQHFAALVGITGLVGVLAMTWMPVSPPRLVGAFDPIRGTSLEQLAHPERMMNEHAAMPSFHVGWSIAAAATLAAANGPFQRLRRGVWIQPALMTVATLTTGNHWVSDAVAGLVLLVVSWRPVELLVAAARREFARNGASGVPVVAQGPRAPDN